MDNKCRMWSGYYKEYIDWYYGLWVNRDGKIQYDDGVATDKDLDIAYEWYTGLKDINGKDIFTGDILKTKAGRTQVVKQGLLSLGEDDTISGFYADDLEDGKPHTFSYDDEIVGNVHENPELLKA